MNFTTPDNNPSRNEGLTIGVALAAARERLTESGFESAALDARVLLGHVTGLSREHLMVEDARVLGKLDQDRFDALVERRLTREPVAYLVGQKEFFGLTFDVNPETLVPRPDTETLVEAALKYCNALDHAPRILDLGTGSGAILLALLHTCSEATGVGVDRSNGALDVARRNAKAFGLEARAQFVQGNWADGIEGTFDLIVTNPPYIPSEDIACLMPDVVNFEPVGALDGGLDGLGPLRLIVQDAGRLLVPGGFFCCEIGQGQASEAQKILRGNGFTDVDCVPDLNGIARCVCGVTAD